ncbi:MAG: pentapeptide repeat-containing protein [Methylophilaceae bacterium]|nr:pentapeptide repeat-containing protein [Methyloradius sp.]
MKRFNLSLSMLCLMALVLSGNLWAAEFNKNCTTSLGNKLVVPTDCSIKTEYQGKTYCFGSEGSKTAFLADPKATIMKAEAFYDKKPGMAMPMAQPAEETSREKITQEQALAIINSKTCDLSNKDLGYLEFDKMDLRHCKMVNTSFFGAYLRGADLSGTNMQGAYLNLARLENTNLSGTDLTNAIIFQAIFDKTNFKGANLTNARMIGTLGAVDISDANVKNGKFGLDVGNQPMGQMKFDSVGGKFTNTNFAGADLNIANFSFADLRNANLSNTNLYRADLSQADLTGADLTGANLTDAIVDSATFKDVKGLSSVKGWTTVKGKCHDCQSALTNQDTQYSEAESAIHAKAEKQALVCVHQKQLKQSAMVQ